MAEEHHTPEQIARAFAHAPYVLRRLQEAGVQGASLELFPDASGVLRLGRGKISSEQWKLAQSLVLSARPLMRSDETGIVFCCGLVMSAEANIVPPSMSDLWQPIERLTPNQRYSVDLLVCAPELVDADCNPHGIAPGYWQDGPLTEGGSEEGVWIGAGYCMQHDHFVNRECTPTHFALLAPPRR